jgi:hypothetical protein
MTPDLNKSYSSYTNDQSIDRSRQIRRDDDTIKTQSCTIYDHDYAILSYIRDAIKPKISENDAMIDVPVQYANGEKWSQIQANGFMRDGTGKVMTPLIMIRRNSITERDILKKLDINLDLAPDGRKSGNAIIMQSKYTNKNRYDRFSTTTNSKPNKEYYISVIPEFVDISYDILIWTALQEQLNQIVEQIMPTGGFAWGTTWKFPCYISDYSFDLSNDPGNDRIVKATLPITMKGTIVAPYELYTSTLRKSFSVKQVKFGETNVVDEPPGGYQNNIGTNGNFQRFYRWDD